MIKWCSQLRSDLLILVTLTICVPMCNFVIDFGVMLNMVIKCSMKKSLSTCWCFFLHFLRHSHLCATERCWVCCPQWPNAGTRGADSQPPPLISPPCLDAVASSSVLTVGNAAPDTSGSCEPGPAGAAGSFLWKDAQIISYKYMYMWHI